jgi:putative intracellular protease/amidase
MSARILFVLTSHNQLGDTGKPTGAYFPEFAHPYAAFVAAGFAIDFVSPKGGAVPLDGVDRKDAISAALLDNAAEMARIHTSHKPAEIDAARYRAIFFAGGHGTMWDFADEPTLAKIAAHIYDAGGVVGAVCHGPAGLVNVRLADGGYLVNGKRVAAFTNEEELAVGLTKVVPFLLADKLTERGAIHVHAANWARNVVVDARLVTGQNPASAAGVAEHMLPLLR